MRILVVGATGALGRPLARQLVAAGHEVVGTTRTTRGEAAIRATGAKPLLMDALDRDSVLAGVDAAAPEVIVHQATALASVSFNLRKFDAEFATTNRLRTTGMANLLEAAERAGVTRVLAQSFGGWPYAKVGGWVKTEEDPLDTNPPKAVANAFSAIRELETRVTQANGLALRYGGFYGPGTGMADPEPGGLFDEMVRRRRFPIIGSGSGRWSFIHVEDAAAATVLAVSRGAPGIYNIVDDEPAPVSEWLPHLARALGAKPPLRLPAWVGRLAGGEVAVAMMTRNRGASNAKAKEELGWAPARASWRTGFMEAGREVANSAS